MSGDSSFSRCTLLSNGVTHVKSVTCHGEKRVVRYTQDTRHTAGLSCDRISWNTQTTKGATCAWPSVPATTQLVLLQGASSKRCRVSTFGAESQWDRSITPAARVSAVRPRTIRTPANVDAVMAALERQPWTSSRVPGSRSTSWRSAATVPLPAERTSVSRRSTSTGAIMRMATTTTRCGWVSRTQCSVERRSALYTRVRMKSTTVTNGHGTVFVLSTATSVFGMVSSCTLSRAPFCYLTGWLLNNTVVFWKPF
jgi:hypothetical protein